MSSVSAANPVLTNLLQTLQTVEPSILSNPAVTAALKNAPASDIVQLSDAALELQNVATLFGLTDPSSASTSSSDPFASLLSGSSAASTSASSDHFAALRGVTSAASTFVGDGSIWGHPSKLTFENYAGCCCE